MEYKRQDSATIHEVLKVLFDGTDLVLGKFREYGNYWYYSVRKKNDNNVINIGYIIRDEIPHWSKANTIYITKEWYKFDCFILFSDANMFLKLHVDNKAVKLPIPQSFIDSIEALKISLDKNFPSDEKKDH